MKQLLYIQNFINHKKFTYVQNSQKNVSAFIFVRQEQYGFYEYITCK